MTRTTARIPALALAAILLLPMSAMAHAAICSCFDNGDGTITCEGGFSDGSSANGIRVFVRDVSDTTIDRGKMNEDSEFTFKKPEGRFTVVFDGGPGHQVSVPSSEIAE